MCSTPASLPLITDLEHVAALAAARRDEYQAFGHYIDIMWDREQRTDAELDALVQGIADAVAVQVDCTRCANCCRCLPVGLEPGDISPLAQALHLSRADVLATYAEQHTTDGEWAIMRCSPCPLLHGNLCAVYAQRPQACRSYPGLTPDFRWVYDTLVEGAGHCPIIFNTLERLKIVLGW